LIAFLFLFFFQGFLANAAELLPYGDLSYRWEGMCDCHYFADRGDAVLHNHITQSLNEILSRDIQYHYYFEFFNHKAGRNIDVLLIPQGSQLPRRYLVNNQCSLLETAKPLSILLQSVIYGPEIGKLYSNRWESIRGDFTGKGVEHYFSIENPDELAHRVDNARVWCDPVADFEITGHSRIQPLNGIQWKIFTPSTYSAGKMVPLRFWNSLRSKWSLTETDSFGRPNGGYSRSSQRRDFPSLGMKDVVPLGILPLPALRGLRYFRVQHEDTCAYSSDFEANAEDFISIRFPAEAKILITPVTCAEADRKLRVRIEFPGSLEGLEPNVEIVLNGPFGLIDRRVLKIKESLDLEYPNPRIAGDYTIQVSTRIAGEGRVDSVSKTFSIQAPAMTINGPSTAPIGAKIELLADSGGAPVVPVSWNYLDEFKTLRNSKTPYNSITLSWGAPGEYPVEAFAFWNEGCEAKSSTLIDLFDLTPRIDLQATGVEHSCDEEKPLEVVYKIDPGVLTLKEISIDWYRDGILLKSSSIQVSSGAENASGKEQLDHGHLPGSYRAEISVRAEVKSGFERTTKSSVVFNVLPMGPESIDVTIARYAKMNEPLSISWTRTGAASGPLTSSRPMRIWTYLSESGSNLMGPVNADQWQKTWTRRGTYPVSLEARWSPECVARAEREVRIVGDLAAYFPSAFTPQGDHLNDHFRPTSLDVGDAKLLILNRWGEILYRENAPDAEAIRGWDGTYGGKPSPDGVYVWQFEGLDYLTGKRLSFSGTVHLLR
jgi:gliding motility-associated-like protein